MKTLFVIIILVALPFSAQSQGLYPLGIGNLWQYWEVPGYYWNVQVVGDTLMPNGMTYRVLTGDGGGFLRQSGPQVFGYSTSTNTEELVYDFSRTTGDTVYIRYYFGDTIVATVYSDQMMTHFGRMLRTWTFLVRSTQSTAYMMLTVADSLGLVSYQGEVLSYGLHGAIINGIQYGTVVSVSSHGKRIPSTSSLSQNYPNPFNPVTTIRFQIAGSGFVTLTVVDALGRTIATLVREELKPGNYSVDWNAEGFSSGMYFYRLQADNFVSTKKMLLLK